MATELIARRVGNLMEYSSVIESEPWGFNTDAKFYNMVLSVETEFTPHQVLSKILEIEADLGRIRHGKTYTNRMIDIDILFYNTEIINDDKLVIPHPLMHKRKFVLQPLAEMVPDLKHPVFQQTISELLLKLNEPGAISKVAEHEEFARYLNTINQN